MKLIEPHPGYIRFDANHLHSLQSKKKAMKPIFLVAYLLIHLSQISDQRARTSSLTKSYRQSLYRIKMGNLAQRLSQRHNT